MKNLVFLLGIEPFFERLKLGYAFCIGYLHFLERINHNPRSLKHGHYGKIFRFVPFFDIVIYDSADTALNDGLSAVCTGEKRRIYR